MSDLKEKYNKSPAGLLYIAPMGSGKTRKAIEATNEGSTAVVGPKGLRSNFAQEEQKAYGRVTPRYIATYTGLAKGEKLPGGENLVIDESHNLRNPATESRQGAVNERSKYHKALLLTGTPTVNEPADLASQINIVAGKQVMPINKEDFYKKYYNESRIGGLIGMIRGATGTERKLKYHGMGLRHDVAPYVYVEKDRVAMPKKREEIVPVEMNEKQQALHKYFTGKLPKEMRSAVQAGLPLDKRYKGVLNSYLSSTRRLGNATTGFVEGEGESPKARKITENILSEFKHNPKAKDIVYSNFLTSGISEVNKNLSGAGIKPSVITGETSRANREKLLSDFNKSIHKVMLISGAGSEGVNMPGVSSVHIMEPHWNPGRTDQAAARGIRRDDLGGNVNVKTYVSTFPKKSLLKRIWSGPSGTTSDQYLEAMSERKRKENKELLEAIK